MARGYTPRDVPPGKVHDRDRRLGRHGRGHDRRPAAWRSGLARPGRGESSARGTARALAREYGIRTVACNVEAVQGADVILFGIKPQMLGRVGREIGPHLRRGQLVLSVLAGATTSGAHRPSWSRPGRPQHAEHPGPARQGDDRLVRHAGDDRGRSERRPRRCSARSAPSSRSMTRSSWPWRRRFRDRTHVRVPRHGGADRRGGPPRLPAPHRPRSRDRDARGLDALRQAVRDAPGRAAQHGDLSGRHLGRRPPRARVRPASDGPLRGGLGGLPPHRRARRSAGGVSVGAADRGPRPARRPATDDAATDREPDLRRAPLADSVPSDFRARDRDLWADEAAMWDRLLASWAGLDDAAWHLPGAAPSDAGGPTGRWPSTSVTSPTGRSSPATTPPRAVAPMNGRRTATTRVATSTAERTPS